MPARQRLAGLRAQGLRASGDMASPCLPYSVELKPDRRRKPSEATPLRLFRSAEAGAADSAG